MAEHFVQAPHWEWYILGYFFLAGLTGGLYALATMLRLWGSPRDEAVARIGFLAAFPLLIVCPILLSVDLGQPIRFWHMLLSTTPGRPGVVFKYWSPMSVGSWALLGYGLFAFISFVEALGGGRGASGQAPAGSARPGGAGLINVIGAVLGLYVASYTGVLLSVSNQPVWSDTWALGGLFLASGLSGSAALLAWLARGRGAEETEARLLRADRSFALLELVLIVLFFANLAAAGTLSRTLGGPWAVVWALVLLSLVPPLFGLGGPTLQVVPGSGPAATVRAVGGFSQTAVAATVLIGVLLMRFAVIFSAQF